MATAASTKKARNTRSKSEVEQAFLSPEELLRRQQEQREALQRQLIEQEMIEEKDEGDEIEFDNVTALNNVLATLGASEESTSGFITVFKESASNGTKSEKYLGKFDITDYASGNLLDHLQNNYGGGRYHVRVYIPRPNRLGQVAMKLNRYIDIAGDAKTSVPAAIASQAQDLSPLIATMQQGFAAMLAAMQANQPKQQSRVEMLEEMKALRDIMAPAASVVPPQNYDPVALMKLGMEMANNGGGDGNSAWVGKMIDHFAPFMLGELQKQQQAKPELPSVSKQALPSPAQPAAHPTEEEQPVQLMLKGYLKMLSEAAARGAPVAGYADSILSMIPDADLSTLENILRASDWQAQLAKHTDVVNAYPGWFESLRNTLLAFIDDDRAADQAEARYQQDLTQPGAGGSVTGHENATSTSAKADDNAVVHT